MPPRKCALSRQVDHFVPLLVLPCKRRQGVSVQVASPKLFKQVAVQDDTFFVTSMSDFNTFQKARDLVIGRAVHGVYAPTLIAHFVDHALLQSERREHRGGRSERKKSIQRSSAVLSMPIKIRTPIRCFKLAQGALELGVRIPLILEKDWVRTARREEKHPQVLVVAWFKLDIVAEKVGGAKDHIAGNVGLVTKGSEYALVHLESETRFIRGSMQAGAYGEFMSAGSIYHTLSFIPGAKQATCAFAQMCPFSTGRPFRAKNNVVGELLSLPK